MILTHPHAIQILVIISLAQTRPLSDSAAIDNIGSARAIYICAMDANVTRSIETSTLYSMTISNKG
jgi:hypothetical protein